MLLPMSQIKSIMLTFSDLGSGLDYGRHIEMFTLILLMDNPGGAGIPPQVVKHGVPDIQLFREVDSMFSAVIASIWGRNLIHAVKEKTPEALKTFRGGEIVF